MQSERVMERGQTQIITIHVSATVPDARNMI